MLPRAALADSVFAFADLVTALDHDWSATLAHGDDLAVTFGIVNAASPIHAMAKVPGELSFCLDLRSGEKDILERTNAKLVKRIAEIKHRTVSGSPWPAEPLDPSTIVGRAEGLRAAVDLHQLPPEMLSGGGHDAAAFAAAGWEASMLFVRNDHSSNPDETMDLQDLAEAVAVLGHGSTTNRMETSISNFLKTDLNDN